MTFSDIFKSGFLENVTSVSLTDMALVLVLSFCLGMFIFFVHKKTCQGITYSSSFGVTLIALTMITALVILAVTSNVVLSLGMVGALSIVRFRTAIKEPLDIAFLFWSIAGGIVLAAGMIPLAVIGSVVIGVMLLLFTSRKTNTGIYILIIQCDNSESEEQAQTLVNEQAARSMLKSKIVEPSRVELTMEVRLKEASSEFVNSLLKIPGVASASLVSYSGDYLGG